MRKQMLFIFLSTLLLSALLLTGCGSDQNTVSENAIPEESTAGHIAPISDPLVIEADYKLSSDPMDYLSIADGTDISQIQLHFEEVNSLRNGEYPASASYGEERVEFTIQIEDTIPPRMKIRNNLQAFSPYEIIYCKDLVVAYDISDIDTLGFSPGNSQECHFEEPGEYEVEIQAKDYNGNISSTPLTITIEEPVPFPNPEATKQIQKDNSLPQVFKDYLLGNKTAVIGEDVDFENIYAYPFSVSPILSGQSASLEDMYSMIKAGEKYDWYSLISIEYGILDCGMDGKPDLALWYIFSDGSDQVELTTIIHEENGELTLSYAYEDWHRSHKVLYQDGYVISIGYGGLAVAFGYDIFDASGKLQDIYYCHTYAWRHTSDEDGILKYIDPDGLAKQDYLNPDKIEKPTMDDFHEILREVEVNEYFIGDQTYLGTIPESDPDSDYRSLSYYLSLCEKHGVSFCTQEEIEHLIAEHMDSLGFADWGIPKEFNHDVEAVEWKLLFKDE